MANIRTIANEAEWKALPEIMKATQWNRNLKYIEIEKDGDARLTEAFELAEKVTAYGYNITAVIFEDLTKTAAELTADEETGAFAVKADDQIVLRQGGFKGFIPECMELEDGEYLFDYCFHPDCGYMDNPYMPW